MLILNNQLEKYRALLSKYDSESDEYKSLETNIINLEKALEIKDGNC